VLCIAPLLVGHSLQSAKQLLLKAHCRLGHVGRPTGHTGRLVIAKQSVQRGRQLPDGAAIAIKVGAARHGH
jgi:hypothetical protein